MLKVWLPLDGDLHNQGISEITFSGTPTWQNFGKIGSKAYNLSTRTSFNCPALANVKYFSVAFWCMIEPNTESTANWMDILSLTDKSINDTTGYFRFETGYGNTAYGGIHWHDNATNAIINGSYIYNTANEQNQWHHIVVTVSNTAVCSYYDGVLKQTNTSNLGGGHLTGAGWIGESTTRGSIQDVRIYDHCLSAAEIKEIAQGLILHYKLDGAYGGSHSNLVPCGDTYTKATPRTVTSNRTNGNSWVPNSAFEAKPSTTYTISVECDGTLSNQHGNGGMTPEQKPWSFWLYICNVDTTKNWSSGAYDSPVNLNRTNHNYRKIGNAHVWTYTLSSTQKYISLRTNNYSDGSTNLTINYWNMKVEEGDTYTSWVPSTMGNLTQIQDSSGYGHNGTTTGDITSTIDTPRFTRAIHLSKVRINSMTGFPSGDDPNFTIAFWAKIFSNITYVSYGDLCGMYDEGQASNTFRLELCGSPAGNNLMWFRGPSGRNGGGFNMNSSSSSGWFSKDTWHHIALVGDGANKKYYCYLDGQLCQTYNGSANTWSPTGQIYLGDTIEATADFSDFRVYCTPLLDTDIKQLYNVGMKIDNKGNTHAYEFVEHQENDMAKITKQGQVKFNNFIEQLDKVQIRRNSELLSSQFIER